MIRVLKRIYGHWAVAAAGALALGLTASASSNPARAYDVRAMIMPASDAELGAPIWQGIYIRPNIGWDTYDFSGAGAVGFGDISGWSFGGQVGYDRQFGRFVLGVMSEGAVTDMDERGGANRQFKAEIDAIGSLSARIGITAGRFLFYGTGGVSFATLSVIGPGSEETETLTGYTVGGGLEYMWQQNAAFRLGYTYSDFGDANFNAIPNGALGVEGGQIDVGFVRRF